jgi:hypothetical protein
MSRRADPWENVALVAAIAAMVGAGVGAGSALTWSSRQGASRERELDELEARVAVLELRAGPVT